MKISAVIPFGKVKTLGVEPFLYWVSLGLLQSKNVLKDQDVCVEVCGCEQDLRPQSPLL